MTKNKQRRRKNKIWKPLQHKHKDRNKKKEKKEKEKKSISRFAIVQSKLEEKIDRNCKEKVWLLEKFTTYI